MGFFSTIKKNLNHGGVAVTLQSPTSASFQDADIKTIVTVTAKDTQTINKISVSLDQIWVRTDGDTQAQEHERIAHVEEDGPFQLVAGETKTLEINVPLDQLAAATQTFGSSGKRYEIVARADVPGIALDPNDKKGISINRPGEFGKTFSL